MSDNIDLSAYRLKEYSEIAHIVDEMGEKKFFEYADKIYQRLFSMQPDETFDITKKVLPENQEKFIKIACCYIQDEHSNMKFNDTFTILKQYSAWQPKKEYGRKKKKSTSEKTSEKQT